MSEYSVLPDNSFYMKMKIKLITLLSLLPLFFLNRHCCADGEYSYLVRKGDTLSEITLMFSGSHDYFKVAESNDISNPDLIFPGDMVLYGIGIAAFVFSIPVFFDVTFVILIPLGLVLAGETKKPVPYTAGAIVIGAACAHTLVPPTPGPIAAAEILGFDLGIMIIAGLVLGLIAALLSMRIFFLLLDRGLWNPEKDQTGEVNQEKIEVMDHAPGAGLSLIPIITPILLILSGTVFHAVSDSVPVLIQFLSHKVIAMLAGAMVWIVETL